MIPVLIIEDVAHAVPLGRALVAGGLPCWRSPCARPRRWTASPRMAGEVEGAVVGAGTVLTAATRQAAADAGAPVRRQPRA